MNEEILFLDFSKLPYWPFYVLVTAALMAWGFSIYEWHKNKK